MRRGHDFYCGVVEQHFAERQVKNLLPNDHFITKRTSSNEKAEDGIHDKDEL